VAGGSVYEAIAAALAAFRGDEWVGQIGTGLTTVSVTVQQPAIEHRVRVQDFLAWFKKKSGSPAEVALRDRLRWNLGDWGKSNAHAVPPLIPLAVILTLALIPFTTLTRLAPVASW